jgi:hypothetical protein
MGSIARGFNASTALLQGPSSPDSSLRLPALTVYGVTIAFCWTVNWQLEGQRGGISAACLQHCHEGVR